MNDDFDLTKLAKAKSKKRINSRTKGKNFERSICKILNARFNTTDFCPTPGSGAFATIHKLPDHIIVRGDLIVPIWFDFVIECKKGYPKVRIADLFTLKGDLGDFIEQVKRDAQSIGKNWLIIFKQDRSETLAIFNLYPGMYVHQDYYFNIGGIYVSTLESLLTARDSFFKKSV